MIALVALAVAVGVIDGRDRIIPNTLSGLVAVWGIAFQALRAVGATGVAGPCVGSLSRAMDGAAWLSPASCLAWAGALLVGATTLELAWRRARGSAGLGLGDVKYLAAWSCVVGPVSLAALALACAAGGCVAALRGRPTFVLGPWLSGALVLFVVLLGARVP